MKTNDISGGSKLNMSDVALIILSLCVIGDVYFAVFKSCYDADTSASRIFNLG